MAAIRANKKTPEYVKLSAPIQYIKLSSLVRRSLIYYSSYDGVKRYLR
nr:MAG TPA: hypothetical protein [Caudoviricetes sp.]